MNAWVSLLMRGDYYLPGILALNYSIVNIAKSKYNLVVMVTNDVSQDAKNEMINCGIILKEIEYINVYMEKIDDFNQKRLYDDWKNISCTKWNCLNLTEYQKIFFIDSDTLMLKNCDDIFDLNTPAGVFGVIFKKESHPNIIINQNGYFYNHGEIVNRKQCIKAIKESLTVCGNSMLLSPSNSDFLEYKEKYEEKMMSFSGKCVVDEATIFHFYLSKKIQWTNISFDYNYIPWYKENIDELMNRKAYPIIIHYMGKKLWDRDFMEKCVKEKWDDCYIWLKVIKKYLKFCLGNNFRSILLSYDDQKNLDYNNLPNIEVSNCFYCGENHHFINEHVGKKYAWVSLMMKGDKYLPGILSLGYSLKYVARTIYDFIVMITDDVSDEAIEMIKNVGIPIRVPYIEHQTMEMKTKKQEELYSNWKNVAFTKMNILNLIQYDKVCLFDADKIVVDNCDELFSLQTPALSFYNPWLEQKDPTYYKENGKKYNFGDVVKPKQIQYGLENSYVCFGTSLVVKPSVEDYKEYLNMINENEVFGYPKCSNGSDETSIAAFYLNKNEPIYYIPPIYGFIPWFDKMLKKKEYPKIIHYFGKKIWIEKDYSWIDVDVWLLIVKKYYQRYHETSSSAEIMNFGDVNNRGCFFCQINKRNDYQTHNFLNNDLTIECPYCY